MDLVLAVCMALGLPILIKLWDDGSLDFNGFIVAGILYLLATALWMVIYTFPPTVTTYSNITDRFDKRGVLDFDKPVIIVGTRTSYPWTVFKDTITHKAVTNP